jgi:hypothetical protein
MCAIIKNPNFAVIQIEMDLYHLLTCWLFLQLNPQFTISDSFDQSTFNLELQNFFANYQKDGSCVLHNIEPKYLEVFKYIRICDILNSFTSARRLEQDNIIPFEWIQQQYRIQSLKMLKIENGHDDGPDDRLCKLLQSHDELLLNKKGNNSLVDNHMNLYSNIMRCGRELNESLSFCWRWTGFNYGNTV